MGGGRGIRGIGVIISPPISPLYPTIEKFISLSDRERARALNLIKMESMKYMEKVKEKLEWFWVNHGYEHAERVAKIVREFSGVVNKSSIAQGEMGRILGENDILMLEIAAYFHDSGIGISGRKRHAMMSGELVRKTLGSEKIAKVCELHSRADTRDKYGFDDVNELVRVGLIDREMATYVSIFRTADVLDIGEERVRTNTQGQPFKEVITKIEKEPPTSKAKGSLIYWYGHKGIKGRYVLSDDGSMSYVFTLDPHALNTHGEDVTFVLRDFLKELNKSIFRGKYNVVFTSDNKIVLTGWYGKYKWKLAEDFEGISMKIK